MVKVYGSKLTDKEKQYLNDIGNVYQCGDVTVYWIDDTNKIYTIEYPEIYWDNSTYTYRYGELSFDTWSDVESFMDGRRPVHVRDSDTGPTCCG